MIIKQNYQFAGKKQPERVQAYTLEELSKMYLDWVERREVPTKINVVRVGQRETWFLKECDTPRKLKEYIHQFQKYVAGGHDNMPIEEILEKKWPAPDAQEIANAVTSAYLELRKAKPAAPANPVNTTNMNKQ